MPQELSAGPEYYLSQTKREFDAHIARIFQPAALFLIKQTATALAPELGNKLLFQQKRYGWNGELINVWKLQTLDKPDYESPAAAATAKANASFLAKTARDLAFDELPQVFQVSTNPSRRGTLSMVAVRSLMSVDHYDYKKAVGRRRYDDWFEMTSYIMGPGVFSLYGLFRLERCPHVA